MGQTSLIAVSALALGWWLDRRGRWVAASILFGISTIKPQLVLLPMAWLAINLKWREGVIAAITAIAISLPAIYVSGLVGAFSD